MKIFEENQPATKKQWALKLTQTSHIPRDDKSDTVYIQAVDYDTGKFVAYIAAIDDNGIRLSEKAKATLEENGYDVSVTDWDTLGRIAIYS